MSDHRVTVLRSQIGEMEPLSDSEVELQAAILDGSVLNITGGEYDPEDVVVVALDRIDMHALMPVLQAAVVGSALMEDTLMNGAALRLTRRIQLAIREQKFAIVEDVPEVPDAA